MEGEEVNNKQTDFYGKFEFKGKSYPFFYKDSVVTIIQQPWEYNKDFKDVTEVEKIEGLTNSNKVIVFLQCKFRGGSYKEIFSNIIFSTKGFILFDKCDCPFECIEFESEALNTFYPPIQLIDKEALLDEGAYKVKKYDETTQHFETLVNYEKIKMELSIPWIFNLQPENRTIGEKYSVWRMIFETPKQSENISAKANKATNNTDKADKKTTPNVKSSAIENKNTQKPNTTPVTNSQNNAEDPFKNYYVLVESYEKELQKDGRPTKYQFATFVDQYNKTIDAVIAPQFIQEFSQCDTGTTVILDLKTAGKLIIANDIKFVQKCPKNVAA